MNNQNYLTTILKDRKNLYTAKDQQRVGRVIEALEAGRGVPSRDTRFVGALLADAAMEYTVDGNLETAKRVLAISELYF